jgi:hypothetical protein
MQIKKDLVSHIEANHPDFKFAWTKSFFYNFQRTHSDGLYDFIFFQRDGKTGALAVEIATSYDPCWDGTTARPIGRNTGLAYLKFNRSGWIEAERNWHIYRNIKTELQIVLAEISGDLQLYAMDFFCRSAQELRSDQLLHYGLSLVHNWKPLEENFRQKLKTDWNAGHLKENPFHKTFLEVKASLHQFAASTGLPTDDIQGYTIHLLYNFIKPDWSWENSRL